MGVSFSQEAAITRIKMFDWAVSGDKMAVMMCCFPGVIFCCFCRAAARVASAFYCQAGSWHALTSHDGSALGVAPD